MSIKALKWFLGILVFSCLFQITNLIISLITGEKLFEQWADIIAITTNAGCALFITINGIIGWRLSVEHEKQYSEEYKRLHTVWKSMGLTTYEPINYKKSRIQMAIINAVGVVVNIAAIFIVIS